MELAWVVVAGEPIEPIPQTERVEVPKRMIGRGETFALRVKGTSMEDEGIPPSDVVVVQKQRTARNGQTVIALVNGEATIKTCQRKASTVELHPANDAMHPIVLNPTDTFQIGGRDRRRGDPSSQEVRLSECISVMRSFLRRTLVKG